MCGIVGTVGPGLVTEAEVLQMCDAIRHRGPDDWGTFVEDGTGIGMRRLSIIDLAGGHQPMGNEDDSVLVVLNGEIYNHEALRRELVGRGHQFRTRSDTEVLVHLYEDEGERMLARLRGMFAIAIWDRPRRRLLLARDHFGQKPLFYTVQDGRLAFASEIKALLARDPSLATLSPFALDQYLTLRFVQPPDTFFERIRALPPAHFMLWETGAPPRIERYWDLSYGPKWEYSEAETLERVDELLAEAVRLHLTSDVPVGAFLSGGLDSTLIAAHAAKVLGPELRTFSMGIPYRDLNELPAAAAVARRYGTRHFAEEVTPEVGADLPRLISALDEPADPLSICLLHLSRMTAREVKVVLGGDGGDELFGGYDRYAANRWLDAYRAVPEVVRDLVASQVLQRLPDQFTFKSFTHKLRWVDLMARKTGGERYAESLQYFWFNEARRAELYTPGYRARLAGRRPETCLLDLYAGASADDAADRMMYVDVMSRLPGQSLMILDRATMAYSLESRSPFLDPRFAEFMARVPVNLKIRGRRLRYLERRLGERYLPPEVLQRKKQGFASPLMYIMDQEVRTLAPALLGRSELVRDGYLEGQAVRRLVRRTPGPAARPRQPDLAAAERGGLVPALHRRAHDGRPRGRAGGGSTGCPLAGRNCAMSEVATAAPRGETQAATAAELLRSAYDWESAAESMTLGAAVQRFRDVNGYVGLPVPAKPAFLKVFRRMINGRRPPEEIYRVHDASHVLTGTTFTHDEPRLVLLAGEAVEQGLYFASRGTPRSVGWVLFYGGAFVECARRIASFRQVYRGIRLGLFNRAYDYARRSRLANLFTIPVDELWSLPVAEARRRLGMPSGGPAAELYAGIPIPSRDAAALRREWEGFGVRR